MSTKPSISGKPAYNGPNDKTTFIVWYRCTLLLTVTYRLESAGVSTIT